MEKQPFNRLELALIAGLIVGMLATPARAEGTVLSRWPAEECPPQYRMTLFPFAVARADAQSAAIPQSGEAAPQYEVKFRLAEWWDSLTAAKTP